MCNCDGYSLFSTKLKLQCLHTSVAETYLKSSKWYTYDSDLLRWEDAPFLTMSSLLVEAYIKNMKEGHSLFAGLNSLSLSFSQKFNLSQALKFSSLEFQFIPRTKWDIQLLWNNPSVNCECVLLSFVKLVKFQLSLKVQRLVRKYRLEIQTQRTLEWKRAESGENPATCQGSRT